MKEDNPRLNWARDKLAAEDAQRSKALPLYVSPRGLPHIALQNCRDFALHIAPADSDDYALLVAALDRIIAQLCSCDFHVTYVQRHEGKTE